MEFHQPQQAQISGKKSEKTIYIIGAIIIIAVIAIFTNGFGLFTSLAVSQDYSKLEIGNSPVLGNSNAPVTIYEFSDFSCPYCAAAAGYNDEAIFALTSQDASWQAPIPKIEEEYVKTGKVKIVFKYFPGHGAGKAAHLVSLALAEQDPSLFWKFHDLAFKNQVDTGNIDKMKSLAQQLGADMNKLESSLASTSKYENQLKEDANMGRSISIKGTPTFIINGKLIEGAVSFTEFQKVIDNELAKK